jgi:hypothetical protein
MTAGASLGEDLCFEAFLNSLGRLNPEDCAVRDVSHDGFKSQEALSLFVRTYPNAKAVLKGRVYVLVEDLQDEAKKRALLNAVDSYEVLVPLCCYLGISHGLVLQEMGKIANWKPMVSPLSLGLIPGSADQRELSSVQSDALADLTGVCCDNPLFFYKGKPGEPESSARAWHIDMTPTTYSVTFSDPEGCTEYLPLPRFDCTSLVALSAPPLPVAVAMIRQYIDSWVDAVIVGVLNDAQNAGWIRRYSAQTEPNTVYQSLPNGYYHRSPQTGAARFHVVVVT